MKKLFSCMTAAVLLAASVMPAAAADTEPAETPETSAAEEISTPTAEERVAEGIAAYERELAHRNTVKSVSAEDTIQMWNDYIDEFNERYLGSLEAMNVDAELKALLFGDLTEKSDEEETPAEETAPEEPANPLPGSYAKAAPAPRITPSMISEDDEEGYDGENERKIPREFVMQKLVERVKEVMPPEEFARMTADPSSFTLYYMDGAIIVVQNTFHDALQVNDVLQKIFHIITLDPISIAWDYSALSATTVTERLYNVLFAMNERNRELAEIEYEMTKMGLWNVNDEDDHIPNTAKPSGGRPRNPKPSEAQIVSDAETTATLEETLNKLPRLVYDLTSGNDTYHVHDMAEPVFGIISEQGVGETGDDTLALDYELDPDDLEFLRINGDLFLNDPVHEVYIMLVEYFSNPAKRIENIRFNDGTVWSYADVCDITNALVGTGDDDTIEGYVERNFIWGNEGNDTIYGNYGDDYLFGGEGDDYISLARHCFGILSNDGGNNFVYGMDGNDTILVSGDDDFIWGGKGDDLIQTGAGSDIIYYELGDGNDIIDDTTGRFTYPYGGHDVVWLGEGILPDEVHVTFSDTTYEYVLHIMKTGETITMPGNMYSGVTPVFPIEEIHFTDGTTWDRLKLLELSKTLYGTDEDDEIKFLQDGDAEFRKDYDGCGTIYGYDGNDRIFGASGNDHIYGGKGDDYMRGGSGDDTFYYELGDGNDTIDMGNGAGAYPQGGKNALVFGEGILPDEVTIERSRDNYTYTFWINKTGESITMTGNVISGFSSCFPIKEFRFTDGTVWNVDYLEEHYVKWVRGTDGNDSIDDSGDNDTVFCGKGNDYIRGKGGDDLFIYEAGDGRDTILDSAIFGSGYNTLQFGEGISIEDLFGEKAKYSGHDVFRFYIGDRGSYVQVLGIDEITFADGSTLPIEDVKKAIKEAAELVSSLPGDLSCDGKLTATDIEMMTDYLSTFADLKYWENADLNQDGILNAADLSILKKRVMEEKG